MNLTEILEIIMDEPCDYVTIAESFSEDEVITIINKLIDGTIVGEINDDGDIDVIIDNLKMEIN